MEAIHVENPRVEREGEEVRDGNEMKQEKERKRMEVKKLEQLRAFSSKYCEASWKYQKACKCCRIEVSRIPNNGEKEKLELKRA